MRFDLDSTKFKLKRPVLVANRDRRERELGAVGQVSWRENAVLEILTDVVHQELDGIAEQSKEDDQPVDLSWLWAGEPRIAESSNGRVKPKVS